MDQDLSPNSSRTNQESFYNPLNGGIRQKLFQMQKAQNPIPNSTVKHSQFISNASSSIIKRPELELSPVRQPFLIPNLDLSQMKVDEPTRFDGAKQFESARVPHKLLLQNPPSAPYRVSTLSPDSKVKFYPHSQNQEQRMKQNLGFTFV